MSEGISYGYQDVKSFNWAMKKGDKFIYTNILGKKETVTYTGTQREVKGVLFDFFIMEDGSTAFFYPSEVKPPMFVKTEA